MMKIIRKRLKIKIGLEPEVNGLEKNINMAGAAGHIISPWEHTGLTFGEIQDIINKTLSGTLDKVSEKLDGQNLMATWKNHTVYIARTKKQLFNKGEFSIRWDLIENEMKTPESKTAYQQAATDIKEVLGHAIIDLDKIFGNGKKWLNIELLTPDMENIIPYGTKQLRVHNLWEVDNMGKIVKIIHDDELDNLMKSIEQVYELGTTTEYTIERTNQVRISPSSADIKQSFHLEISRIMDDYILTPDNTIGDYLEQRVRNYLLEYTTDSEIIDYLVSRWIYGANPLTIVQILKNKPDEVKIIVKKWDSDSGFLIEKFRDPIVLLFDNLATIVLHNTLGLAVNDPIKSAFFIRKKAIEALEKVPEYLHKEDSDPKKIKLLQIQNRRLSNAGGISSIVPTEGIVFEYNGQMMKLSGIYLYLLKIISFFRFGRDK
jgi:hypothetical protein